MGESVHAQFAGVALSAGLETPGIPPVSPTESMGSQSITQEGVTEREGHHNIVLRAAVIVGNVGIRGAEVIAGQHYPRTVDALVAHVDDNQFDPNPTNDRVQSRLEHMRGGFWGAFRDRVTLKGTRDLIRDIIDEISEYDTNDPRNEGEEY